MELMIAEILIKAAVLAGILYFIAKDEADFDFQKVAMVVAGITLGTFCIDTVFLFSMFGLFAEESPFLGLILRIGLRFAANFVFVLIMIVKFCWVSVKKGILATILFFVFNSILVFGVQFTMAALSRSVDEAGGSLMDRQMSETLEAAQMAKEMLGFSSDELSRQAEVEGRQYADGVALGPVDGPLAAPGEEAPEPEEPEFSVFKMETTDKKDDRPRGLRGSTDELMVSAVFFRDGRKFAVVNNMIIAEGDVVEYLSGKTTNRLRIAEVRQEGVIWEAADDVR